MHRSGMKILEKIRPFKPQINKGGDEKIPYIHVLVMLYLVYAYLMTGLLVAIWFCFFGAGKIDAGAARSGIGFKLIILPAALLLWPLVLRKGMKGEK
jgi:hypothetical protein